LLKGRNELVGFLILLIDVKLFFFAAKKKHLFIISKKISQRLLKEVMRNFRKKSFL